jgi:hypothetical protein
MAVPYTLFTIVGERKGITTGKREQEAAIRREYLMDCGLLFSFPPIMGWDRARVYLRA